MLTELKRHVPAPIKQFVRHLIPSARFEDAKRFVGTDHISGQLQFELIKREGCLPDWRVFEIGCGCLHLGIPLIQYLDPGHYVGLDPNPWLREQALKATVIKLLAEERQARFSSREDFDVSFLPIEFDLVFSHSVLSHCAHWQLDQFLQNTSKVLARNGKILSSIRLAEGNAYGSEGHDGDSLDKEWVYPGVSWFRLSTVKEMAAKYSLRVELIPEYTEFYTQTRPTECHDWLRFSR